MVSVYRSLRKIANIFVEDDRVALERSSFPAIGSIHTKAELKYIIGTGFLIDACYVATSYHLIKSNDEKKASNSLRISIDIESYFCTARPTIQYVYV